MKLCDILGVKTYSDPFYTHFQGQDPLTPRIYAPADDSERSSCLDEILSFSACQPVLSTVSSSVICLRQVERDTGVYPRREGTAGQIPCVFDWSLMSMSAPN